MKKHRDDDIKPMSVPVSDPVGIAEAAEAMHAHMDAAMGVTATVGVPATVLGEVKKATEGFVEPSQAPPTQGPVRVSHRLISWGSRQHHLELTVVADLGRRIAHVKSSLDGYVWCDITFGMQPKVYQREPMTVSSKLSVHELVTTVTFDDGRKETYQEDWKD